MDKITDPHGLAHRRQVLARLLGLAASGAVAPLHAWAADAWPQKPIRFLIPYPPGGGTDLMMRTLQVPLQKLLGQPIVIDNKSGAAGAIAAKEIARAAPDGYNLLVSNDGPSVIVPLLQKDAGYDPVRDFTPITPIGRSPIIVIAHPGVPATDAASFIAWARQQAEGVAFGTAGVGSFGHLAAEQFAQDAKVKLVHVPYRGNAPTIMAVLSGEAPLAFTSASDLVLTNVANGKLKLLGVGSLKPTPLIPGGMPIASTLPGYHAEFWQGVLGPARLPAEVAARLHAALREAVAQPEVQEKFRSYSYTAETSEPAVFAKEIRDETAQWKQLIKDRGIHAET